MKRMNYFEQTYLGKLFLECLSILASGLPKIHCFGLVESCVICHIKWDLTEFLTNERLKIQ